VRATTPTVKQAKKIKGQTSEGFMTAFRKNERATKTLASSQWSQQKHEDKKPS
jgi:hypothetical protein